MTPKTGFFLNSIAQKCSHCCDTATDTVDYSSIYADSSEAELLLPILLVSYMYEALNVCSFKSFFYWLPHQSCSGIKIHALKTDIFQLFQMCNYLI